MGRLVSFLDVLLNWTLHLGPFWGILVLALLTGLFVMLAQKYLSDQRRIGLIVQDTKLLGKLVKQAKKERDKEKVTRYQRRRAAVGWRRMVLSFRPVFFIMIPLVLLVTWCQNRLAYLPWRPQQEVEVRAYFSEGAEGFAHIVPMKGLRLRNGGSYVQPLEAPEAQAASAGLHPYALWHLGGKPGKYPLRIRYQSKSYVSDMVITEGVEQTPPLQYHVPPSQIADADSLQEEGLLWVEFGLQENVPIRLGKLRLNWMWSFLPLAIVFGLGFRFIFRVK
jgi:hypothetical protein